MSDTSLVPVPEAAEAFEAPGSASLTRQPIWYSLNAEQKALLQHKSPNLSNAELAQAVELAVSYGLDPYANEIWFSKSKSREGKPGRLLIMTGRDGIRKIVQRNGCEMECDAVYADDDFGYVHVQTPADLVRFELVPAEPDGSLKRAERYFQDLGGGRPFHHVTHRIKKFNRGELIGSWARAYERRTGIERGFFIAALANYDPGNISYDSPWKKQKPVMIIAAAERQAGRQATPLGGLLVEGEDDVINASATEIGRGDGSEPEWDLAAPLIQMAEDVITRAEAVGHARYMDRATWKMQLNGQLEGFVTNTLNAANAELDELAAAQVAEPAAPEEDAVTDGGTGSPEPAAAVSEAEGSTRVEQAGPDLVSSTEDVSPEPSPQDASTEDVQGVLMCPVCAQPWEEHSTDEQAVCNATADVQ